MVEFMRNRMKLLLFLVFWLLAIFSNFTYSYAELLTIQPGPEDGKDSYISKWCGGQSKNFGNNEDIYVGYYDCNRGLLRFDLSSISSDASISSAELYLYLKTSSDGDDDYYNTKIYVHRVTNFWKEEEVTWKDRYRKERWDSEGGDFDWTIESSASVRDKSSGWVSWDVTRTVKDWFNEKYINFGFLLRQNAYNKKENRFFSNNIPWVHYRPKLVVSYKLKETPPEPVSPSVKVYPNPFKPTLGHSEVKFVNLPSGASVRIFYIDGEIVRMLREKDGKANWDVKDDEGEKVSSGFYLYHIETDRERYSGKIVIIR